MRREGRKLYEAPRSVLAPVRANLGPRCRHRALATELVTAADEIAARAPWLWLDMLFVVENAFSGAQFFGKAFEVTASPTHDAM